MGWDKLSVIHTPLFTVNLGITKAIIPQLNSPEIPFGSFNKINHFNFALGVSGPPVRLVIVTVLVIYT